MTDDGWIPWNSSDNPFPCCAMIDEEGNVNSTVGDFFGGSSGHVFVGALSVAIAKRHDAETVIKTSQKRRTVEDSMVD